MAIATHTRVLLHWICEFNYRRVAGVFCARSVGDMIGLHGATRRNLAGLCTKRPRTEENNDGEATGDE